MEVNLSVLPPGELAAIILDESGYTEMWQQDKTPEAPGRLDNLKELISGLEEFEKRSRFSRAYQLGYGER